MLAVVAVAQTLLALKGQVLLVAVMVGQVIQRLPQLRVQQIPDQVVVVQGDSKLSLLVALVDQAL
jgi:hypothetical protein